MSNEEKVTVILCTYNRASMLVGCLESLRAQSAPKEHFSVLVIDNNSTDDTQRVVASYANRLPGLRVVFEPVQGLSHARNRGLAEARTEWVAFLDDDAKALPEWVDAILDAIAKDDFDAFGGPYYAWHRFGPPPAWLPEDFGTYLGPGRHGRLGSFHIPGGNCAFKKSIAQALGGFSTEIGMVGSKCAYGEETLLFNRMKEQGQNLGFVPAMAIDHCVLPYKYTLRWQFGSAFAEGRDAPFAFDFPATSHTLAREGWHLSKSLVTFPLVLLNAFHQGHAWQRALLECIQPVLFNCGSITTMIRLLAARTR